MASQPAEVEGYTSQTSTQRDTAVREAAEAAMEEQDSSSSSFFEDAGETWDAFVTWVDEMWQEYGDDLLRYALYLVIVLLLLAAWYHRARIMRAIRSVLGYDQHATSTEDEVGEESPPRGLDLV